LLLKRRWLAFINICSVYGDSGYDRLQKLKQEEQNFMTKCRMVTFALQWCPITARLMNWQAVTIR
jgi:hypothetical protein